MPIAPVVIEFLVKNQPRVEQSFRGVQDTANKAERSIRQTAEREAKAREKIADAEAKLKVRAWQNADKLIKQAQQAGARDAQRLMQTETKAADRAAQDRVRSEKRAADAILRIKERSATMAGRYAEQQASTEKRALDKKTNDAKRATDKLAKDGQRSRDALLSAGGRGLVAGAQRVGSLALQTGGIAAQLGGGFSIADSVQRRLGAEKVASQISASSMGAGSMDSQSILSSAKATATLIGDDPTNVLEAIGKFKDLTGNTRQGTQLMPQIAKLATAFGGDVGELAENAGNIAMSNPDLSNDQIMKLLRIQTAQGAAGAVEVKDVAKFGSRLVAGAGLFGGDASTNIATMGALTQIARQHGSAATPAEATMASLRFATDIAKHADALKASGINVSDGKGGLRDSREILMDMVKKSGGDVTKMGQFGLGDRGNKVLMGFGDIYRKAGGGKTGEQAITNELTKYTTDVSEGEVDKRFGDRMNAPDKKFDSAMNELRTAVGEQLLPEFIKLIPTIREMTPVFVDLVHTGMPAIADLIKSIAAFAKAHEGIIQSIAAHPIGSIMALEVTKSIVSAGIGDVIKRLLGGGGGGPTPPGGGGGGPGPGTALAAAAVTYAGAKPIVDAVLGGQTSGQFEAGQYISRLKNGSADDKARAVAELQSMQKRYTGGAANADLAADVAMTPASSIYSLVTGDRNTSADNVQKAVKAREILDTEEIKAALTKAIQDAASSAGHGTNGASGGAGNSGSGGAGRSESIVHR